jgi:hypothetical protein
MSPHRTPLFASRFTLHSFGLVGSHSVLVLAGEACLSQWPLGYWRELSSMVPTLLGIGDEVAVLAVVTIWGRALRRWLRKGVRCGARFAHTAPRLERLAILVVFVAIA